MKQTLHTLLFRFIKNHAVCACMLSAALFATENVAHAEISVSPLLIEHETEARDILERTITVTNVGEKYARVYASVHEVALDGEGKIQEFVSPVMTDRKTTIASWIEVTRARIELPPGSSESIPLTVRIHPNTPPGRYHALVGFVEGRNRDEVEQDIIAGKGSNVLIKIVIEDTRTTSLDVLQFVSDRFSLVPGKHSLSLTLANSGDVSITPQGEFIIYDNKGMELTSIPMPISSAIEPGATLRVDVPLPFFSLLGRHKVNASLEYGPQSASLLDTTFYYSLPWYYVAVLFVLIVLSMVSLILMFRRQQRASFHGDVQEVPLFHSKKGDHIVLEHDLNLKN